MAESPSTTAASETATPTRQCGRCRETFPGDPTLHATALREWWLCPPCHDALFAPAGRRG
jgi:hypothetical protein